MKAILQFIASSISSTFGMMAIWLISFLGFELTFVLSGIVSLLGGVALFFITWEMIQVGFIRKNGLTRKEYRYIESNLKEAKGKISRLQRALMSVRSIDQAKQNFEIIRTVRRIYTNTKKEPSRFYKAEGFFYERLDSLVELADKYAFLSSQPGKTSEVKTSLQDTRRTIQGLGESVKKDLYIMLDEDIDTLHFELDVAKNSINRMKKKDRRMFK
ncbi:5-bromo-4-chloroindolyl phosphate hydrolysis family protein [Oceanobacillus senegalensis]|uniref:5-bromo-4-chloroindolyl phosphate hydrolysis family protein n=1 Tax=Oceanobacillus senegalensis TaxID=1936063 RepID=UPI000A30CF58|nr:5-bromo-4-chloroindolyl phosphate hydrolysis family protein [Oceanobacillus senegalensis]